MTDFVALYRDTRGLSVLLAEDHDATREEMRGILEELFREVVPVANGADALAVYESRREEGRGFDLVITDIRMPCMNGVALVRTIRQLVKNQPIIVLSAHTDSEYLLELINAGLSHFLTKPLEHRTFFKVLGDVCGAIEKKDPQAAEGERRQLGEHLVWDARRQTLYLDGSPVDFSRNELLFFSELLRSDGRVVRTQTLIETFYHQGIEINENGIRNLVLRLRKKLPRGTISTVYGLGYRLQQR